MGGHCIRRIVTIDETAGARPGHSFDAQGLYRIDGGGALRGNDAGDCGCDAKSDDSAGHDRRVDAGDLIELRLDVAHAEHGDWRADREPCKRLKHGTVHHHGNYEPALGAQRGQLLQLMLVEGLRPALFGLGLGLVVSVVATRVLQSLLFGTRPLDPVVLSGVIATLLAVAVLACLAPAWRASRLDPMQALRTE